MTSTTNPTSRGAMYSLAVDFLRAALAEMARAGLRPAGRDEHGQWWTSLDGSKHWVTRAGAEYTGGAPGPSCRSAVCSCTRRVV